jgi:hypothetical protein
MKGGTPLRADGASSRFAAAISAALAFTSFMLSCPAAAAFARFFVNLSSTLREQVRVDRPSRRP